jgi:hypothetical protein
LEIYEQFGNSAADMSPQYANAAGPTNLHSGKLTDARLEHLKNADVSILEHSGNSAASSEAQY